DASVEDNCEPAADILAGYLGKLSTAFPSEREAHRRLVVFVERGARTAQIGAGDRRRFSKEVEDRVARIAARTRRARHDLGARRQLTVLQQLLPRRCRLPFNEL